MKRLVIMIPTDMEELKIFLMNRFGWLTHRGRMKKNKDLLNDLYAEICYEIKSGYWSKDISRYMITSLTSDNGKIEQMIDNVKKKLV